MQAIVQPRYGPPEILEFAEVSTPEPGCATVASASASGRPQ